MPFLEVLNGPEAGLKCELIADTFFIGRDVQNHLTLSDRTVSRRHAVINKMNKDWVISDLQSLKGLTVNGQKVDESALRDSDDIWLGAMRLRFYANLPQIEVSSTFSPSRFGPKKWGMLFAILIVILAGLLGNEWWQARPQGPTKKQIVKINEYYERGLKYFNEDRDYTAAREEWFKVYELDPSKSTQEAKKIDILLQSLPKE